MYSYVKVLSDTSIIHVTSTSIEKVTKGENTVYI